MVVYDSLDADTTNECQVTVLSLPSEEMRSQAATLISSKLIVSDSDNKMSFEETGNFLGVVATALNRVNCTVDISCASLNRNDCSATPFTCGTCYEGFYGEDGDRNSACFSQEQLDNPKRSTRKDCQVDEDCLIWQQCTPQLLCEDRNKTCENACSSNHLQGNCKYRSALTLQIIPVCSILAPDSECFAQCECSVGFTGKDCSQTEELLNADQDLRALMLAGVYDSLLSSIDVVSSADISSTISLLHSIVRDKFDVAVVSRSNTAKLTINNTLLIASSILSLALDENGENQIFVDEVEPLLTSLESVVPTIVGSAVNTSIFMLDSFVESITIFGDLVMNEQVAGESPYTLIGDIFRLIHQEIASVRDDVILQLPSTKLEQIASGFIPATIRVKNSDIQQSGLDSLFLQAIEYDKTLWVKENVSSSTDIMLLENQTTLLSNIVQFRAPLPLEMLTIVIPFDSPISLNKFDYYENVTFHCYAGEVAEKEYNCSTSGVTLSFICSGSAGKITRYCPTWKPSCHSLTWADQTVDSHDDNQCISIQHTSNNITCQCSLKSFKRRKLASSYSEDEFLYDTGILTMVTMASYTTLGIGETFAAADDMDSLADIESTTMIIVLLASLWSLGGVVLIGAWWKRKRDVNNEKINSVKNSLKTTENRLKGTHINNGIRPRPRERTNVSPVSMPSEQQTTDDSYLAIQDSNNTIKLVNDLIRYVDSILPPVYVSSSFLSRFKTELLRHHAYLNIIFGLENSSEYSNRGGLPWVPVFHLLTIQTMLIFLLAVLYDLQYPSSPQDRQKCYTFITKDDCLRQKSLFDDTETFCQWLETSSSESISSSIETGCTFIEPDLTLQITLYCAIISSLFTAAILRPLNYLFVLLSAPSEEGIIASITASSVFRSLQGQVRRASVMAMNQVAEFASILPGLGTISTKATGNNNKVHHYIARFVPPETDAAHKLVKSNVSSNGRYSFDMVQSEIVKRMSQRTSVMKLQALQSDTSERHQHDSTAGDDEYSILQDLIYAERKRLLQILATGLHYRSQSIINADWTFEKQFALLQTFSLIFDRQWGLQVVSDRSTSKHGSVHVKVLKGSMIIPECGTENDDIPMNYNFQEAIRSDLISVTNAANKVVAKLKSNATDTHIGMEIIQLFIQDLLGRETSAAKIFRSKLEEDFSNLPVVKRRVKVFVTVLLVLINIFFIYFTILRGFERGKKWQRSFVMGCVIQIIVEMCLYETCECVWINIFVPNLVTQDVHNIYQILRDTVEDLGKQFTTSNQDLLGRRGSETKTSNEMKRGDAIHDKERENNLIALKDPVLNVPDFLFISNRVAKEFPNIVESVLVMSFCTTLPGTMRSIWLHSSQRQLRSMKPEYSYLQIIPTFLLGIMNIGTFFVYCVSIIPFDIQRMIIRFIQPYLYGGIVVLWYMMESNIWLEIAVFIAAGMVIIALFIVSYRLTSSTHNLHVGEMVSVDDLDVDGINPEHHHIERSLNIALLIDRIIGATPLSSNANDKVHKEILKEQQVIVPNDATVTLMNIIESSNEILQQNETVIPSASIDSKSSSCSLNSKSTSSQDTFSDGIDSLSNYSFESMDLSLSDGDRPDKNEDVDVNTPRSRLSSYDSMGV